jgi:signal transduction histidine kinase
MLAGKDDSSTHPSYIDIVLDSLLDIQKTTNEHDACEIALLHLDRFDYPAVMLSFLERIDGLQYIVANPEYATNNWKTIAADTIRPFDISTGKMDLLPAVLKRRTPRFIQDSRLDSECDQALCITHNLITQYVVPLATDSMLIGTLQVDMGSLPEKPVLLCNMIDALAAHLSLAIERYRTLNQLETINNELLTRAKVMAFEVSTVSFIHDLNKALCEYVQGLNNALNNPEIKSNKAAYDFLRKYTTNNVTQWLTSIKEIMSLSRSNETKSTCDIVAITKDTLNKWYLKAKTHSCSIKGIYDLSEACIKARRGALYEILTCLFINSLEAHAREITVHIKKTCKHLPSFGAIDCVEILCIDDGDGIPPSFRDTVKEFGWTSKGDRGHGIGLAVIRLLSTEMNGDFQLVSAGRSANERNTAFSLTIPLI